MSTTHQPATPAPSQPSHYPGEYRVSRGAGGEPFAIEGKSRTLALVKTCGDHTEANANLFAAAPSLYAYAKAVDLRDAWDAEEHKPDNAHGAWVALEAFLSFLRTMGWDNSTTFAEFLRTYLAAALAKAEGK